MTRRKTRRPTPEQCDDNASVLHDDGGLLHATWFPLQHGCEAPCYVSADPCGCFDVYLWTDPDSPEDDEPKHLHFCDPDQFVRFGSFVGLLRSRLQS